MNKKRKPILYAAALNKDSFLTIAKEAPRKRPYSCVNCGNPMRVRRGPVNRPHFAHINKEFDSTCRPETVLHKSFKIALHNRIQECLNKSIGLPVEWKCNLCGKPHSGNLLKKVFASELEHKIGDFIADVALIDIDKKTFGAIEVVVTNKPKMDKISFYKNNEIWITIFRLEINEDLLKAFETPLRPTSFNFCPDRKKETTLDSSHKADKVTSVLTPDFSPNVNKQSALKVPKENIGADVNLKLLKKVVLSLSFSVVIIFLLWQWLAK